MLSLSLLFLLTKGEDPFFQKYPDLFFDALSLPLFLLTKGEDPLTAPRLRFPGEN